MHAVRVLRPASEQARFSPEAFRDRLEAEVTRHNRHLAPFGLLRVGGRRDAMRELLSTEVRRTDAGCLLPDGSCVVLALHAGEKQLRALARRLVEGMGERPVVAILPVEGCRVEAEVLWLTLNRLYAERRHG